MEKTMLSRISVILKKEREILLAYVFGSSVKEKVPKCNDIDVAILLRRELYGMKKMRFLNAISSKIEKEAKQSADVVILNGAPPALKQQVIKYGRLLFEREKGLARKLTVDTITAYLDYLNILNFFYSRTVKRGG